MIALLLTVAGVFAAPDVDEGVRQANEAALALASVSGLPAQVAGGTATCLGLRLGKPDGPAIAVVPVDILLTGDFESSAGQGPADLLAAWSLDPALHGALAEANFVVPDVLFGGAGEARHRGVDPMCNFPGSWELARRQNGAAAGPFPASLPRVRGLVQWLLTETNLAGVLIVDDRGLPAAEPLAPGSLAAFAEWRLGVPVAVSTSADLRTGAAMGDLLASLPKLAFEDPKWSRVGPGDWAFDVTIRNQGATATGEGVHRVQRRGHGLALGPRVLSAGMDWVASAVQLRPGAAFEVLVPSKGALKLPDLGPGESVTVRLFLAASERERAVTPELELIASGPRAVNARSGRLTP